MGAYIMDHFIDRERAKGLMVVTKAYAPLPSVICHLVDVVYSDFRYKTIPLAFLHKTLAFDSLEDTRSFLQEHQITTFINPNSPDIEKILDCKAAIPEINRAFEDKYRKVTIKGAI
jgi:hypothetical protein